MKNFIKKIISPRNLGAVIAILIATGATALAAIPAYKSWLLQGTNLYTTGTNIGIGTVNPQTRLHVADDNSATGGITIGAGGPDSGNLRLLGPANHWNLDNGNGRLRFFTETGYGTGGSEKMTILGNGNVGIGTTNPSVAGGRGLEIEATGSNHAGVTLDQTGTGGRGYQLFSAAANPGYFGIFDTTAGFDRFTISSTGNVGIGTVAPGQKLEVAGNLKVSGAGNGVMFPDGTVQTTAGGGGGGIGGSGTPGVIPKFTSPTTLGDSIIGESGNTVSIGTGGIGRITAFGGPGFPIPTGTIVAIDGDIGPSYEAAIGTANPFGSARTAMTSEGFDQFGNTYDAGAIGTCGTGVGGQAICYGGNSINTLVSFPIGFSDRGYIGVLNQSWPTAQAGMYVDAFGQGIVFGSIKNFREPNPNDPTTDIWYASVEGPEAAAYIRGTAQLVNGSAVITFPDHFRAVAAESGMTVQFTPLSADSKGLAAAAKRLDGVSVRELLGGTGTYAFDWEVKAVRKGHENYRVIRPKDEARPAMPTPRTAAAKGNGNAKVAVEE